MEELDTTNYLDMTSQGEDNIGIESEHIGL
jgi:hypothetical protein